MKVRADHDVCIGSGLCALRAPSVFDQDTYDGTVVILQEEPAHDQQAVAIEAVRLCPSGALRTD